MNTNGAAAKVVNVDPISADPICPFSGAGSAWLGGPRESKLHRPGLRGSPCRPGKAIIIIIIIITTTITTSIVFITTIKYDYYYYYYYYYYHCPYHYYQLPRPRARPADLAGGATGAGGRGNSGADSYCYHYQQYHS